MKNLLIRSQAYKPLSIRAAKYFFVVNDMVKMNSLYQFTHEWFIEFYTEIIRSEATTLKENTD